MSLRFAGKIYAMTGLYDYIRSALSKFIKSKGSDTDFYEVCSRMLQDKRTWKANDFHDICSSFRTGEVVLDKEDYEITSEDMPGWLVATEGKLTVAMDITITD